MLDELLANLRTGKSAVWLNPELRKPHAFDASEAARHVATAEALWQRFAPALAKLFDTPEGDGRIHSPLLAYPNKYLDDLVPTGTPVYVKADHALPITACVKARGGIFALLVIVEEIAVNSGVLNDASSYGALAEAPFREMLSEHTVVVASTGNLGFSIGLVATAFGLKAEVYMSDCAKEWKKERLRSLGATVVECAGDYTSTVSAARTSVSERHNAHFIDDENSWDLFVGYAGAGAELAGQLDEAGVAISVDQPLIVYLPCGVGGAPGGITYGLRTLYGDAVITVFVEPTDAACMLVALASGKAEPTSVYDVGLENLTEADGLAVSRASALVLDKVRSEIDAVVAVPDEDLLHWVRRAWSEMNIKLEPSAAAGFAALVPFQNAVSAQCMPLCMRTAWQNIAKGVHVVWTTGGDMMPDDVFRNLLKNP